MGDDGRSSATAKLKSKISQEKSLPQTQTPKKRRKSGQKVVVTVKIETGTDKKKKNEKGGPPPSDCWSWRKYGQKPIKGSPYPRGYYRCSTSKGCSAKKQVERSRTDASVLIITYTSTHNHPGPDLLLLVPPPNNSTTTSGDHDQDEPKPKEEEAAAAEREQKKLPFDNSTKLQVEDHVQYYCESPLISGSGGSQHQQPYAIIDEEDLVETTSCRAHINENSLSYPPQLRTLSTPKIKSEENDFYDELEELPTSSFFASFMRRNFFEERILVDPS